MKKILVLSALFMTSVFGQNNHPRPVHPIHVSHPIVVSQPVIGYDPFLSFGGGYYGYQVAPIVSFANAPVPCKKEKLKDSNGKKHDILVCRQPSGSWEVVADADKVK